MKMRHGWSKEKIALAAEFKPFEKKYNFTKTFKGMCQSCGKVGQRKKKIRASDLVTTRAEILMEEIPVVITIVIIIIMVGDSLASVTSVEKWTQVFPVPKFGK